MATGARGKNTNKQNLPVKPNWIVGSDGISYVSVLELLYASSPDYKTTQANTVFFPKDKPAWIYFDMLKENAEPGLYFLYVCTSSIDVFAFDASFLLFMNF